MFVCNYYGCGFWPVQFFVRIFLLYPPIEGVLNEEIEDMRQLVPHWFNRSDVVEYGEHICYEFGSSRRAIQKVKRMNGEDCEDTDDYR